MPESYERIVENLFDTISKKYSYLLIKKDEFEEARKEQRHTAPFVKDNSEFMYRVGRSLSLFKDCHIRIVDGQGNGKGVYNGIVPKNYDFNVTKGYVDDLVTFGPIKSGRIDDITYLCIDSFHNREKKNFDALYSTRPESTNFIVDLRANTGGNDSLGKPLVSFMMGCEKALISAYSRYRTDEDDPSKLTDFVPRYVVPETSLPKRKVIVLTGAATCSAAELITMDLAAIPGTLLFGDVTSGSSGCPQRYLLDGPNAGQKINYEGKPNDHGALFGIDLPSWLRYRLDQVLLQDSGITPHCHIRPQDSIVSGRDRVLEKAIDAFKNGYIPRSK